MYVCVFVCVCDAVIVVTVAVVTAVAADKRRPRCEVLFLLPLIWPSVPEM